MGIINGVCVPAGPPVYSYFIFSGDRGSARSSARKTDGLFFERCENNGGVNFEL